MEGFILYGHSNQHNTDNIFSQAGAGILNTNKTTKNNI